VSHGHRHNPLIVHNTNPLSDRQFTRTTHQHTKILPYTQLTIKAPFSTVPPKQGSTSVITSTAIKDQLRPRPKTKAPPTTTKNYDQGLTTYDQGPRPRPHQLRPRPTTKASPTTTTKAHDQGNYDQAHARRSHLRRPTRTKVHTREPHARGKSPPTPLL